MVQGGLKEMSESKCSTSEGCTHWAACPCREAKVKRLVSIMRDFADRDKWRKDFQIHGAFGLACIVGIAEMALKEWEGEYE